MKRTRNSDSDFSLKSLWDIFRAPCICFVYITANNENDYERLKAHLIQFFKCLQEPAQHLPGNILLSPLKMDGVNNITPTEETPKTG